MGETAIYHWPWPDLPEQAHAPDAFSALADAVESTMANQPMLPYLPVWTSVGRFQPNNPLTRVGFYRVTNGYCDLYVFVGFGAATSGGSGGLAVSLPVPAYAGDEQYVPCKLYLPSLGDFAGQAFIDAATGTAVPKFPVTVTSSVCDTWRSTVDAVAPGTGIPLAAGNYSVQTNGNVVVCGRYRIA